MSAFATNRLRPIINAVAIAAIAFGFCDLLLRAVLGADPRQMAPPFDPVALIAFYGRIAAFEVMQAAGNASDDHLVAVIGMSSVKADLDPSVLGANDPLRRKWLCVGAEGRNITQVSLYARSLLASRLKPRLVVLAIHPFMLRATVRDSWEHRFDPIGHLRQGERRLLVNDFFWLGRNQYTLEDEANFLADRARERVRSGVGLPFFDWYPIDNRPWDSWNKYVGAKAPEDYLENQREGFAAELTPDQFGPDNGQPQALRQLVKQIRDHGSDAICVLMPESSQFRALYPPVVVNGFGAAVAAASTPGRPVPVIDLRESMPDEMFYDYSHLNAAGRLEFSARLGRLIPQP
jgi:hypothetical protein